MFLSSNWQSHRQGRQLTRKRKFGDVEKDNKQKFVKKKKEEKSSSSQKPCSTAIIAMDCEMVGVGRYGKKSMLARCSIVNFRGEVLYDKFVKPMERVTDYRTDFSGIRPQDLRGPNTVSFSLCQKEVSKILERRVLVGHSISNDLHCLYLSHPKHLIRDTAYYKPLCPKGPRALKTLARTILGKTIQTGEHDSVEDARSTLEIYKKVMDKWESKIQQKGGAPIFAALKRGKRDNLKGYRGNTTKITKGSESKSAKSPLSKKRNISEPEAKIEIKELTKKKVNTSSKNMSTKKKNGKTPGKIKTTPKKAKGTPNKNGKMSTKKTKKKKKKKKSKSE